MHARTLKAALWHQEQKLVQCSTCKQRFGQFGFFLARQRPKNGLTRFKRHFLAKCPGVNGLRYKYAQQSNSHRAVKRRKQRHFQFFRALKFESVQAFTSAKFARKQCTKCPDKANFAPIKLVDASYFTPNTYSK